MRTMTIMRIYCFFEALMTMAVLCTGDKCKPFHPKVIVFPRTPKTGSTMLMNSIYHLANKNDFKVKRPMPYYNVSAFSNAIDDALQSDGRWLVQNHNFLPWRKYANNSQIAFINFLRDPITRCLSYYKYISYGTNERKGKEDVNGSSSASEKISNCINDRKCNMSCGLPLYKHFCGHIECELEDAIDSLILKNMILGTNEMFQESALILERRFPTFFKGLVKNLEHSRRTNVGFSTDALMPHAKLKFIYRIRMANDLQFFSRAVANFWSNYEDCIVRFPHFT